MARRRSGLRLGVPCRRELWRPPHRSLRNLLRRARGAKSGFKRVFSLSTGIALGFQRLGQRPLVCLQTLRSVTRFVSFEQAVTEFGLEIVDRRLCLGQRAFISLAGLLFRPPCHLD